MKKILFYSDSSMNDILDYLIYNKLDHDDIYQEDKEVQVFKPKETSEDNRFYLWGKWHFLYQNDLFALEMFGIASMSAYSLNFEDQFFKEKQKINDPDEIILFLGHKDINYNLKIFNNVDYLVEKYINNILKTFPNKKIHILTPKKPHIKMITFHEGRYYTHEERMVFYNNFVEKVMYLSNKHNLNFINVDEIIKDTHLKGIENSVDHMPSKDYEPLIQYLYENIFLK